MNRSSFILGVAMLVVAVTLAVTITVRNAPRDAGEDRSTGSAGDYRVRDHAIPATDSAYPDQTPRTTRRVAAAGEARDAYQVGLPAEQLALLPADERVELSDRAVVVGSKARGQLERMTEEFALTAGQRRKMFPMLVRQTAGYDPRMQVGGVYLESDPGVLPDEEVHDLLDAEQREQLVDDELERQLWWQEIFSRLEKDLIDSTGGAPTEPVAEPADDGGVAPPAVDEERTGPAPRTGGSLGELLGQ